MLKHRLTRALVSGTSFFDNFDYFTGYDPTGGFVHYLNLEQATQFVRALLPFYIVYIFSLPCPCHHDPHRHHRSAIGYSGQLVTKNLLGIKGPYTSFYCRNLLTAHRISPTQRQAAPFSRSTLRSRTLPRDVTLSGLPPKILTTMVSLFSMSSTLHMAALPGQLFGLLIRPIGKCTPFQIVGHDTDGNL